ncbi:MAG: VOC family protein [Polyangiaceae bacterium]
MQKITTCLWFDHGKGDEAIEHYISIFPDSEVVSVTRNGEVGAGPKGSILTATIRIAGQEVMILNGGPQFQLNEAMSLSVRCESQQEIDRYWEKLLEGGGEASRCGWLKDRFGLSWQIVPAVLTRFLADKDQVARTRQLGDANAGLAGRGARAARCYAIAAGAGAPRGRVVVGLGSDAGHRLGVGGAGWPRLGVAARARGGRGAPRPGLVLALAPALVARGPDAPRRPSLSGRSSRRPAECQLP